MPSQKIRHGTHRDRVADVRILFVENHLELATRVATLFLSSHEVVIAATIAHARQQLRDSQFDAVLVDYDLDDGTGDELVRWLVHSDRRIRIVAVSGRDVGNAALLAAGAHACCPKLRLSTIADVLTATETSTGISPVRQ